MEVKSPVKQMVFWLVSFSNTEFTAIINKINIACEKVMLQLSLWSLSIRPS